MLISSQNTFLPIVEDGTITAWGPVSPSSIRWARKAIAWMVFPRPYTGWIAMYSNFSHIKHITTTNNIKKQFGDRWNCKTCGIKIFHLTDIHPAAHVIHEMRPYWCLPSITLGDTSITLGDSDNNLNHTISEVHHMTMTAKWTVVMI